MTDPEINEKHQDEPALRKRIINPRGVLQKNMKPLLYLGAVLLVILAALFSSHSPKAASKSVPAQPALQDNTDNNIQDLRNGLAAERQKQSEQAELAAAAVNDPAPVLGTSPQRAASYGANGQPVTCTPGQPCVLPQPVNYSPTQAGQVQPSPEQQAIEQLAAKERERTFRIALLIEYRFCSTDRADRCSTWPTEFGRQFAAPLPAAGEQFAHTAAS